MAPPRLETVLASLQGEIAVIKYNRPNNANALGPQTMGDLLEALKWADATPSARVILLTGVGKFFSAGME
jgi:enoyl-CoA hydratase/carnithine racemase